MVIVLKILGITFVRITPTVDTDLCRVNAIDFYLWSPYLPVKLPHIESSEFVALI